MEQWKDVIGWEGYYQISNLGNVKSLKRKGVTYFGERDYAGHNVNPIKCSNGYMAVNLTKQGLRQQKHIHVLVLEAFIGQRPLKYDACHNNGIKADCRLDNLRWDTRSNNHKDKIAHGTYQVGDKANRTKINKTIADEIKKSNLSRVEIMTKYNLSSVQIWRIKNNLVWKNNG
jgi:hypothetical protein